jgi:outer membrane receptor protein involved in Fe transport
LGAQTWFFDLQASYEFRASAGASFKNGWPTSRYLLDHTSITLGCTNIFDHDPPRSNDNFPRFIYDPTGRFIYVSLKKAF